MAEAGLVPDVVAEVARYRAIRRDLHAHPELSYEELRTGRLVAEHLASLGLEVHTGIGATGVVASLRAGPGPAIGLRADMDALPLHEENRCDHASRYPGRMHACGHDGHTAMLLAAAGSLSRSPPTRGTVHFIFQPAEERGAGARRMIEEGLFERFPCDAVFALHNWPGLPAGTFAVRPGPMMAGTAGFAIDIEGRAGHAALPHLSVDPVMVAAQVAVALQMLVSRELDPLSSAVLSITQIHAGESMNAIPQAASLKGTVRSFEPPLFRQIEDGMRRVASQVSGAFGATATLAFTRGYPPLVNDPSQTAFARTVMAQVAGDAGLAEAAPTMAAEDFAYMLQARPGCYAFLGNGSGAHRDAAHGGGPCTLHSGSYDFNDELIPVGASYWFRLAHRFLAEPGVRTPGSG